MEKPTQCDKMPPTTRPAIESVSGNDGQQRSGENRNAGARPVIVILSSGRLREEGI